MPGYAVSPYAASRSHFKPFYHTKPVSTEEVVAWKRLYARIINGMITRYIPTRFMNHDEHEFLPFRDANSQSYPG